MGHAGVKSLKKGLGVRDRGLEFFASTHRFKRKFLSSYTPIPSHKTQ